MRDESRRVLADLLRRRRAEIVEQATDWVTDRAVDLRGRRPREETRALVERVVAGHEAALLAGDPRPLGELVEFVTSFRAAREFHVSTMLRGFGSFRSALELHLREEGGDGWAAFEVLAAVDDVYHAAACQVADTYMLKLTETVQRRRRELEDELGALADAKERELTEKIRTIEEQRRALAALSSPVIRVWEGVLVAPLVGELGAARAGEVLDRVLGAIEVSGARAVLVDITGLTLVDASLAGRLVRILEAARLLGAEGILVGASAAVARALVESDADLGTSRIFGTLQDGLRAVIRGRR